MFRLVVWLGLLLGATACAGRVGPAPVLDARFEAGRRSEPLAELLAATPLAPDQARRVVEIGADARTRHLLVWIRDREEPHAHADADLLVVILRGHGGMRIGAEERPVGPGSILYVPRGSVHAFRNAAAEPAAAYAVMLR